ncbi:Phospholipid-transporting ATPase 2 [Phytophthora cinnamomi]|uniref:Phospholipid-transporting ATPase 2 n=1 Tax=Phytophthora cinnamomi TaxID=4785 RepID=UPI003559A1FD|nr:Phospholipid-transporting ATPase 2 [Phytophthora cinnamomi]
MNAVRSIHGSRPVSVAIAPSSAKQCQSEDSDASQPAKKKRVYKKRKATHTVRKEEKQALEVQIKALESKLEALRLQALVQRGDEDASLSKKAAHNSALRDAVQEQYLMLAHTQGMMLGCALRHSYEVRPTEMFIRLSADLEERHQTLKVLREPKLYYARRFILERSRGMHPTTEYFHEERYETPEGDFCNIRFDRVPLRGVRGGIRAVLGALKSAAFNAEIIISETSGNLTIREDDDLTEEDFSQLRLVTQTNRGILVENNLIHFTDFSRVSGQDSYAVTAADFVDEDERFPYRPHERVRRDATAAILVTSHVDKKARKETDLDGYGGHTSSEEEGEPVVVITRWAFTRICRTELSVPIEMLRELRDLSGRVSETILNTVRQTVGLST